MNFGLEKRQKDSINSIFLNHFELDQVIIYGSRAKNTQEKYSDFDLTLKGENLDLTILQKIEMEIDDLLLPYKFDISIFNQIENEELLVHINRVGKVFYKKEVCVNENMI